MSPSSGRPGTYLSTGWRIVGAAADRVAERTETVMDDRLRAGTLEDTLFALDCTVPALDEGRANVERVLDAVTEEIRLSWADCPRLLRDEDHKRSPSRFGGLWTAHSIEPGKQWVGEVIWRSVHPLVAGSAITTRLVLQERPNFLRIGVRVTSDDGVASVRGDVGAGQAQPKFLRSLRSRLRFFWQGGPLEARRIRPGDEEDFVHSTLSSSTRAFPVVVLAPLEDGAYVIAPEDLAWELFGRARLHVFEKHEQTFALTDTVRDRRMSCFQGAARCYLPGWSLEDDPLQHPLLLSDRLTDPVMRAGWMGGIGRWMGQRVQLHDPLQDQAPQAAEPVRRAARIVSPGEEHDRSTNGDAASSEATTLGAPVPLSVEGGADPDLRDTTSGAADPTPLIQVLTNDVSNLARLVGELVRAHTSLGDEVERLHTLSAVRSSSTNAIERRLGRLEALLERLVEQGIPPASATQIAQVTEAEREVEDEGRLSLTEVVRAAEEVHSDALLMLDSVLASAAASPYEDPERVRAILDAMATVARRRRDNALGTSLRDAFSDLGIDYRGAIASGTSARLRQQYTFHMPEGEPVQAEEHIVLGNTYDPRRCLRIYFSSRVPTETRFVIGHVGRHFEVGSSS